MARRAASAFGLVLSQHEENCRWQNQHSPQAMSNGTTIRSPFLKFRTSLPTATTSPIGSWPRTSPGFMAGRYMSYRCRSDPQMQVDVTLMTTSFGSSILGSGTVSQRTSDLPCQQSALIGSSGSGGVDGVVAGAQDVECGDADDGGD